MLLIPTLIGTAWFKWVEGWSLVDALYMTVITLSTVGYEEVHPLSERARIFVIVLLTSGFGVFLFAAAQLGEMIVRAELGNWLKGRGMSSALKSAHDHFIICGFGRMGRTMCRLLADRNLPFVVIDQDENAVADCEEQGWLCVLDDATSDSALFEAGIERARGLATVLDSDADNLYVVVSARIIAPNLRINARAADENSAHKMERAGADRVISLYAAGAATMAQLLINPHVEDFFEIFSAEGSALDLAEIRVKTTSPFANLKLSDTNFRTQGIIVVAIRRANGDVLLPPPASAVIRPGDELVALGKVSAISEFLSRDEASP